MLCLDSFSLCRYVDEFDIDTTDNVIHKHIPFAVLLIKIAQDWKRAHNGKLPANVRELKVNFLSLWLKHYGEKQQHRETSVIAMGGSNETKCF
jgi:transcriptional regulatory protein LevR